MLADHSMLLPDASSPAERFIRGQPWFAGLNGDLGQRVAAGVYTLRGAKGEVLLHAGADVKGFYAVLDGLVSLQSQSSDGRRQGFLGMPTGQWFGEGSAMKDEPRRYEVIALRDTALLCLPRPLFEELRRSSLDFAYMLAEHLNMRLGQAMAIIESMRLRTPEERVAMYLRPPLWLGSARVGLSQEELGILAGLSRQTVNKVLKDMERQGLVGLEFGRILVTDAPGLATLLRAS